MTADLRHGFNTALAAHRCGELAQAEAGYREILTADLSHADAHHLLGVVALQTGRHALAIESITRAVELNPAAAAYHTNLGSALGSAGRLSEAIACFTRATALQADDAAAHDNLGNALMRQGHHDAAAAAFRRALDLRPNFAATLANLGSALAELGRLDEAADCLQRALERQPGHLEAHNNLGRVRMRQMRIDEATTCFRTAIALEPHSAIAHANLGHMLLKRGEFAEGWVEREWRWRTPNLAGAVRHAEKPQWRGEHAAGLSILLHAEQGYGDTLQFCRFAPLVSERGMRVVLEAPATLVRLLRTLPGVAAVVATGDALPQFDLQCPLLSLPLAFGTTQATIPGRTPYLRADPAAVKYWRSRLQAMPNPGLRVGLVWAGNPRHARSSLAAVDRRRSIDPALLGPLSTLPNLHLISLQKDSAAPFAAGITDVMAEMMDFADTAALVANLDLVVSVDTAVAHLAGALGKPVWVMNRFDSCWRWLTGRSDSPWYPMLRLYDQRAPGDWSSVIASIASNLSGLRVHEVIDS